MHLDARPEGQTTSRALRAAADAHPARHPLGWTPFAVVGGAVAGAWLCQRVAAGARWLDEPVHSSVEAIGAAIALGVATLLLSRREALRDEPHVLWVVLALTCMGTLDLAHAAVAQGPAFYWSRTLPTLAGGALMAGVWLGARAGVERIARRAVAGTALVSLAVGVALVARSGAWPLMFSPGGGYTAAAKLWNMLGGLGFAAAGAFFLRRYRGHGHREDLVLADHCLLFGVAGLLFGVSHMWDAVWWWFHFLRLAAYVVVLVYVFDLHRRSQGEQGALRARLEFQQLMMGTVGHDLRGPLTAMKMTLAALRQRGEPAPDGRAAERLERSVRRMEELVQGIVDFTRIRAGSGIPVDRRPCSLADVVARAVDETLAAWPTRRIECSATGNTEGTWDPARVAQLASNLLQNATRYSPDGTAIEVAVDGARDDAVTLTVHNLGDPIDPAAIPHLFEPFRRGDAARDAAGLGLGLFIVREIARAHDGHVGVDSSAVAGTTFAVTLPRAARATSHPA